MTRYNHRRRFQRGGEGVPLNFDDPALVSALAEDEKAQSAQGFDDSSDRLGYAPKLQYASGLSRSHRGNGINITDYKLPDQGGDGAYDFLLQGRPAGQDGHGSPYSNPHSNVSTLYDQSVKVYGQDAMETPMEIDLPQDGGGPKTEAVKLAIKEALKVLASFVKKYGALLIKKIEAQIPKLVNYAKSHPELFVDLALKTGIPVDIAKGLGGAVSDAIGKSGSGRTARKLNQNGDGKVLDWIATKYVEGKINKAGKKQLEEDKKKSPAEQARIKRETEFFQSKMKK